MKTKSKLLLLKKIVRDKNPISKNAMLNALEQEDIHISLRTLERYLKELTDSFFIEYSSVHKGYIKNELIEEDEFQLFMHLLNVEMMSKLIITGMHEKMASRKIIQLNTSDNFKGIEHIQTILDAIKNNKLITLTYNKQFIEKGERTIIPQFLKEYHSRWYLIGLDINKNNGVRTFGLDRVHSLKTGEKLKCKSEIDALNIFDNMIGVDRRPVNKNYKSPVKILFKALESLPNYFKSLPFHKSQILIEENDDYTIFSIELFVNYEFLQHIFMYSPSIQVIEPQWLVDEVKNVLLNTLNRYESN